MAVRTRSVVLRQSLVPAGLLIFAPPLDQTLAEELQELVRRFESQLAPCVDLFDPPDELASCRIALRTESQNKRLSHVFSLYAAVRRKV
jgi:hypothetical protein